MKNHLGLAIPPVGNGISTPSALGIMQAYGAHLYLPGASVNEGNYVDSFGKNPLAATNNYIGYAEDIIAHTTIENGCANSEMVGAAPPTLPTGMAFDATVTTLTCVGAGTEDGMQYIDISIVGTPPSSETAAIAQSPANSGLPTIAGEMLSANFKAKIISNPGGTALGMYMQLLERNSSNSLIGANSVAQRILLTTDWQDIYSNHIAAVATCDHVTGKIAAYLYSGVTYNLVIRIARPQFSKGSLRPYAPTTGTVIVGSPTAIPAYQSTTGFKPQLGGRKLAALLYGQDFSGNWSNTGGNSFITSQPDSIGGNSATLVQRNTSGVSYIGRTIPKNAAVSTFLTAGAVVKKGSARFIVMRIQGTFPAYAEAIWDLDNNAVYNVRSQSGFTLHDASLSILNNGWVLINIKAKSDTNVSALCYISCNNTGNALDTAGEAFPQTFLIEKVMAGAGDTYWDRNGPVTTSAAIWENTAPYAWKGDGVDDRLTLAKPSLDFNGNCFRVIAIKTPPVASPGTYVYAGAYGPASGRGLQVYVRAGGTAIYVLMKDSSAVGTDVAILRAADEKTVIGVSRTPTLVYTKAKGETTSPFSSSVAQAQSNWTATNERILCYSPGGSDGLFCPYEVYGMITGNGSITPEELDILIDYLASIAGIIFVP